VWWSTTSPTCCPLPKMAVSNLAAEGPTERTVPVNDANTDALAAMETTDDPAQPAAGLQALAGCPPSVRLLAHPRLRDRAGRFGMSLTNGVLYADEPLPYSCMIAAMVGARGIITDSGALQKEALLLGAPCTTLRSWTEWPETLPNGWRVLVSDLEDLISAVSSPRPDLPPRPYVGGTTAERVASELGSRRPTDRSGDKPTLTGRL
jgi:UDP-N-acetylglucosamine 2-epimerase (non-hydrolysing)